MSRDYYQYNQGAITFLDNGCTFPDLPIVKRVYDEVLHVGRSTGEDILLNLITKIDINYVSILITKGGVRDEIVCALPTVCIL